MKLTDRRWFLTGIGGDVNGREFLIVGKEIRFGRSPDNDIVVSGKNISRHHASIFLRGDSCWIQDQESKNGTFINEQVIKESPLVENDILRIGTCRFRVGLEELTQSEGSTVGRISGQFRQLAVRVRGLSPIRLLIFCVSILLFSLLIGLLIRHTIAIHPPPASIESQPPGSETTQAMDKLQATDEEVDTWRSQAQSSRIRKDLPATVSLLRKVVAARPSDHASKAQLVKMEKDLKAIAQKHYENGAREFEKLYLENAREEWRKVLALTEQFDPDLHQKTVRRLKEVETAMAKRR